MQPEDANQQSFKFPKKEKICSRIQIENLLAKKQKIFCYPVKCYYDFQPLKEETSVAQVVVCIPKRNFKHAVDRNLLKRRIREAYRLHHSAVCDKALAAKNLHSDIFFYYVAKEILPYNFIESKIIEILKRLSKVDL